MKECYAGICLSLLLLVSACNTTENKVLLSNGIEMIHHKKNDGQKPQFGDFIGLRFQHRNHKDSIYQNSFDTEPSSFKYTEHLFQETLLEGLGMMSVGDSASFLIPVSKLFPDASKLPRFIRSGKHVTQIVTLDYVKDAESYNRERRERLEKERGEDQRKIVAFVKENKLEVSPTAYGYWLSTDPDKLPKSDPSGKEVWYQIKMSLLDGTLLYQSSKEKPEKQIFGQARTIPSQVESLLFQLPIGSEETLILPSRMAYGRRGISKPFKVPPYSPIVYELQVEKVDYVVLNDQ